jgi:hypothetical protein
VLPVADGESLRYFRGKAIRNALNGYLEKKLGFVPIDGVDDPSNSLVYRDLVPLVRYFRARFERNRLHSEEKVIRTELWFGSAPIPPRGQRTEVENLARRATALGAYREKRPSEVVLYQAPPEGTVRQEVDIQWRLEFVVTPQSPS